MGLLIALGLSLIAALAERGSQSGQPGSAGTQPGSRSLPANLGLQFPSRPAAQAPSIALPTDTTQPTLPAVARRRIATSYAELPLAFVPNTGETDRSVRYYAQGAGYGFYFTRKKAVLALQKGRRGGGLDMRFLGANPNPELVASDRGTGRVNLLTDSGHPTDMPTYGRLVYRDLWPGIDMAFRGERGKLKYEFRLRPGADPSDIRLAYRGADRVSLAASGALLVDFALGTLKDSRPRSFQQVDGRRIPVTSRYALNGDSYGFAVGHHDRRQPLVIDPGLVYSTFLGGEQPDTVRDMAVDSEGAAYVTGQSFSPDFPTTAGAFDTSYDDTGLGDQYGDVFVTKFDATGSDLVYSTFLGGSAEEIGFGIAVDSEGAAYVTGRTGSPDFPTTPDAFDTRPRGLLGDFFVVKLDPTGSGLVYSTTEVGGDGIAIDSEGAAYVAGNTYGATFPTTPGAFATCPNASGTDGRNDGTLAKLDPTGSSLAYATCLGGSDEDGSGAIAVDSQGAAYVSGVTSSSDFPTTAGAFDTTFNGGDIDAFVTKVNASGTGLIYSTYLGGSALDQSGFTRVIAVDASGSAYVAGNTTSEDFPTTAGVFDTTHNGDFDAFVAKFDPMGSELAYSTYIGGCCQDRPLSIAVDSQGVAYAAGWTESTDFPTTAGAVDTTLGGPSDDFVIALDAAGGLLSSTYLGGEADDAWGTSAVPAIALSPQGTAPAARRSYSAASPATAGVYMAGSTQSSDFPTTAGAFETTYGGNVDGTATKLDLIPAVGATATTVSCSGGKVAVGQPTTCTATVTDIGPSGRTTPSGSVSFSSDSTGSFGSGGCTLSGSGAAASCQVTYTPSAVGSGTHELTASYGGDGSHSTSSGNTSLTVISPQVTSVSPADSATGVARTAAVVAVFNEAMDKAATQAAFSLKRTSDNSVVAGAFSWYGNALIFSPSSPLANGTQYSATVSTAAKDLYGNTLATPEAWHFTTATQPLITSVSPANGATEAFTNTVAVAVFDTAMDKPSAQGAFSLKRTSDNSSVAGAFSWYGNALIFKPGARLREGVQYTANVSTAAKDLAGHPLPATRTWRFTTTNRPIIESTSPASGTTGVAPGSAVVVAFTEAMDKPSAQEAFSLKRTSDNSPVAGAFSWYGNALIFSPTSALSSSTGYTASESSAAKDLNGNALLNPMTWRFTTR
jgi:Bacterial Ig-like domain/Beta-propeller repeat